MTLFTRRDALQTSLGALAGATLLGSGNLRAEVAVKDVPAPQYAVEKGASLRVLRPAKFVQGDETLFLENTKKFSQQYGVEVKVDSESWEDLRPKTATAAAIGSGPDIVLAWSDDPHKFASRCLDLTDLATYLGEKYGGWWPIVEKYGQDPKTGKWIAMPIGGSGNRFVYRKSWVNEAGYEQPPRDLDGFLDMCRKLKAKGHPIGFALGNAVGDANSWCHWLIWTFGGALTDEDNKVTINSKETIEALKYGKALAETFVAGAASWLDPSNNKAFLAGEISGTGNGISIYYAAKNSQDPAVKAMAEDIYHAAMPIGPVGRPTERALIVNSMVFQHTKYPNAAKEYLRFMMEKEQYEPWLTASIGYWNHPLKAYDGAAIWSVDPKHEPYKHVLADALWDSYKGTLGEASAAVLADFVIVQMVAAVATGQATPEDAAREAERRAKRYYKS
ncbi:ABC transporter substrate-binding protein [Benzoatithermus flavus]|uniref:Extracellular solute-binding protein n=1 Tax=Benzoatithermus flavus TaxID=3108223 RepID=A0ABU8XXF1_9PROT